MSEHDEALRWLAEVGECSVDDARDALAMLAQNPKIVELASQLLEGLDGMDELIANWDPAPRSFEDGGYHGALVEKATTGEYVWRISTPRGVRMAGDYATEDEAREAIKDHRSLFGGDAA